MVYIVSNFLSAGLPRWLAFVTITSFLLFFSVTASCLENKTVEINGFINEALFVTNNSSHLRKFDELEKVIESSTDRLSEGKRHFEVFIKEIESSYGISLTIQEACLLIRENLHALPEENRELVLEATELFSPTPNNSSNVSETREAVSEAPALFIKRPFIGIVPWLLFFNKQKDNKHSKNTITFPLTSSVSTSNVFETGKELPGGVYAGGAEILGGALLLILTPVYPTAGAAGLVFIGDGVRRILNAVEEEERNRNLSPNIIPPPRSGGISF